MTTNNPPREGLVRALTRAPELVRDKSKSMPVMRGHFAVWDSWTEINSAYEGRFMERFAPGSMTKTLSESRDKIRVLFQHGRDPQIGDKPLGPIRTLEPDEIGARYEVPLLDTSYNRDLIPGLEQRLYGASFRFEVVAEQFDRTPKRSDHNPLGLPERTVTEARVREFGPVTFPAYANATAGLREREMRSMTDEFLLARLIADPERLGQMIEQEQEQRARMGTPVTITYDGAVTYTTSTEANAGIIVQPTNTTTGVAPPKREEEVEVEPEPSEATTPQVEPEPSEATTRVEPGIVIKRFNTTEEWLEWISRI